MPQLDGLRALAVAGVLVHHFSVWAYPEGDWREVALHTLATLVAASASWYLLEKPLNRLKRYFAGGPRPAPEGAPAGARVRPAQGPSQAWDPGKKVGQAL
jgi:peptidoglycan/LPS O-acetylase OafA/YrhL